MMGAPVGYGLPWWIDTDEYLTADETRAVGERKYGQSGFCLFCRQYEQTQNAHIVRKGMGGKKNGSTGPTVTLCKAKHDELDTHQHLSLAIRRRDGAAVWLEWDEATNTVEEKWLT